MARITVRTSDGQVQHEVDDATAMRVGRLMEDGPMRGETTTSSGQVVATDDIRAVMR
jgi:hypothetical protein